jgi:phosphatidylinositol alpha-1,6-mannosyltransferase
MKILVTLDFPPEKGGIQTYLHGIVRYNYSSRDLVIAGGSRKSAGFAGGIAAKVMRVHPPMSCLDKKVSLIIIFIVLAFRFLRNRNTTVECGNVYAALPSWILHKLGGPSYRVYTYGTELCALDMKNCSEKQFFGMSGLLKRIKTRMLMDVLQKADRLYALGSYTQKLLNNIGIRSGIEIVHPKIELPDNGTEIERKSDGRFVILCVGRLVEHKGHLVILDAVSRLPELCDWELVIAGDGPMREKLEKAKNSLRLKDRIFIRGYCSDEDLNREYCRADVLVLPSLETKSGAEGFGIVMLEAMARKVAIIASDSGGIPEVLDNGLCGMLVKPGDAEELADALLKLYGDAGLRRELAEKAYRRLVSEYVWNFKPVLKTAVFLNHWASRFGGAEYSLIDILSYAAKQWDCHLISIEDGKLHEKVSAMGVKCHVLHLRGSPERFRRSHLLFSAITSLPDVYRFAIWTLKLKQLVSSLNPAFIHANVPKSHVALMALRHMGYRETAIFHMREIFARRSSVFYLYSVLFPLSKAKVFAISKAVADALPAALKKNTEIIYNGIKIDENEIPDKPLGGILKLLYLGRVVPWKGCHELVTVMEAVRAGCPDRNIQLSITGDTSYWSDRYRFELAGLIEKAGLSKCCFLMPHTENPQKEFNEHHVFVNASYKEPFGRSIAEAQACGLPVIAFDSGGAGEIVENNETGFLVPHKDYKGFADAVIRFAENPRLIQTMGAKARARTRKMFNVLRQAPYICQRMDEIAKNS